MSLLHEIGSFLAGLFLATSTLLGGGPGTINQLSPFTVTSTAVKVASTTANFQVPSLANCDTIDTNGSGVFSCGTDGGGGGSGATTTLLADSNTFSGNNTFSNTITGAITGNAGSATVLQNSRNINGTAFNGSANITITAASSTLLSDNNTFTNLITGSVSGNAGTATALAGNGTNASAGNAILGVDASGAAEGAFDVWTEAENTSAAYISDGNTNWDNSYGFTTFSYLFPSDATTTVLTLTNGASIPKLTNLTSNGFVKTGSGNGTLSIDTTTYESGLTAGDGLTRTTNDFDCDIASGTVFGCLSTTDWTTFNNKSGFSYPFPSNATTTQIAFNGGLTAVGATTTALAVTGSSTISSVLNVGGAINAASTLSIAGAITSTATAANVLPYASSTAITVSGSAYFPGSGVWNSTGITLGNSAALYFNGTKAFENNGSGFLDVNSTSAANVGLRLFANGSQQAILVGNSGAANTGVGYFGLATSTPGTRLSVNGDAVLAGIVTGQYFVATSTLTASRFTYASTTMITATTASTTNQVIGNTLTFGGVTGSLWNDFCASITGGAGLCDGTDDTGGNTFAYPFPGNATSSNITFNGSLISVGGFDAQAVDAVEIITTTLAATRATSTNLFGGRITGNTMAIGGTATTTIDSTGNIVLPTGASLTDTGTSDGCATFSSAVLISTGAACGTGGGGGTDFTYPLNYGVTTAATSSPLWAQGGLFASSSVYVAPEANLVVQTFLSHDSSVSITLEPSSISLTGAGGSNFVISTGGGYSFDGTAGTGQLNFNNLTDTRIFSFPDVAGTLCLTTTCANFGYPFPSNATTTLIDFQGGLKSASTTLTGPFVFANATGTNATTTNLYVSGTTILGTLTGVLKATSGVVSAALLGVADLATADFGDWSCNGSACTIDANAVALTTDTTGNYVESITGTANQISVANGSGAEDLDATLSLPSHVIFPGNFQATNATTTNATTTSLNVLGEVDINGLTSALILTGAGGILAEYAGSGTCTNQFVTALSALGATTCASINNAQWSGTDLSVANGGTGLSTFGGTNTVLYTTAADTLASEAAFTYVPATDLLTTINASTTNFSIGTWLGIPVSTNPTIAAAGTLAINTTAASSSLRFFDGTAERSLYSTYDRSFSFASSTLAYSGSFGAAGTTTILLSNPYRPMTLVSFYCKTNAGTAYIEFTDGTNKTDIIQCTTSGAKDDGSIANSTWVSREDFKISVGTSASSPSFITVTATLRDDAD